MQISHTTAPLPALVLAAAALLAISPALARKKSPLGPSLEVQGKLVVKGVPLSFERAWLVRGPDTGDETKPAAYLILSNRDLGTPIAACKDIRCVLFDAVKEGAVLEPLDERPGSFWLRVVAPGLPHREEQLSGRSWTASRDERGRLAGRLSFSYSNTRDEADLEIDASLAKAFPVRGR
ncbi:MAG: hypothetical protein ACRD16_00645 [Thermoanaerobaculia bacterium]